jgi:hypothetical protein
MNPTYEAEALGVPVYTVGIGDTVARRDLVISRVLHNSVAYAGTNVPIQVTVQSSGYSNERIEVALTMDGSPVARETITIGSGTGEYRTTLFMTPDSSGTVKGTIAVTRLEGETTYENNSAVFFTTVLSGKRSVLLLAGAPGQDVGFIRRILEADSNIAVTSRVERPGGQFLEGELTEALLRESDAVFLIGYPGPYSDQRVLRLLAREEFRSTPVFFMLSRTLDISKLKQIEQVLPVTLSGMVPVETQVFLSVPDEMRQHPILRFGDEATLSSLPPVFRPQGSFRVRPEAQILGTIRIQSTLLNDPLLVIRSVAGRRSIALLGYGVWRWKMLSRQGSFPDSPLDEFIRNSVQWMTAIDDQRTFRVSPSKQTFSALEPIQFRGEVYDETMNPVDDAAVQVEITGEGRSFVVRFSSLDNGQYEASGDIIPPGEYSFTAVAQSGGVELGSDRGSFTVGGLQAEFLETRLNRELLRNIAYTTGGAYFDAGNLDGLDDSVVALPGFREREVTTGSQFELWNSVWILGCILLLLSTEWFFRKRLGLL